VDEQRLRDDVIERELKLALRTSAAAPPGQPHLDAEAAAAWMDRRLDAGAAQSVEAHLAVCADCQALVATLARITPAPEEAAAGAGGWSWWRRPWLVPAAAAAALALVVWVSQAGRPAPTPESMQARAEEKTAPAPADEFERTPKARSFQQPGTRTPGSDALPPEPAPERRRAAATPASAGPAQPSAPAAARPAAPLTADRAAAEAAERTDRSLRAEPPLLDAQAAGKAAAAGGPPTPAPPAEPAANRQESAASAVPRALRETDRFAGGQAAVDLIVVAADGTGRWRRAGTSIEFAAGATAPFAAATLPLEAAALTAGSSPAGTVCWLVGRAGAVLMTTDGIRFARVNPPAAIDFVAVAAADARNATIAAADGRRFRTADQGATWRLLDR
jgi:hypothetical protein